MSKTALSSLSEPALDIRVQHVVDKVRAMSGALDLVINKAEAAEDHDLWGFCMLLSDGIDDVMMKLLDIKEAADLLERSAQRKGGAA